MRKLVFPAACILAFVWLRQDPPADNNAFIRDCAARHGAVRVEFNLRECATKGTP